MVLINVLVRHALYVCTFCYFFIFFLYFLYSVYLSLSVMCVLMYDFNNSPHVSVEYMVIVLKACPPLLLKSNMALCFMIWQ